MRPRLGLCKPPSHFASCFWQGSTRRVPGGVGGFTRMEEGHGTRSLLFGSCGLLVPRAIAPSSLLAPARDSSSPQQRTKLVYSFSNTHGITSIPSKDRSTPPQKPARLPNQCALLRGLGPSSRGLSSQLQVLLMASPAPFLSPACPHQPRGRKAATSMTPYTSPLALSGQQLLTLNSL